MFMSNIGILKNSVEFKNSMLCKLNSSWELNELQIVHTLLERKLSSSYNKKIKSKPLK